MIYAASRFGISNEVSVSVRVRVEPYAPLRNYLHKQSDVPRLPGLDYPRAETQRQQVGTSEVGHAQATGTAVVGDG